MFQNLPFAIQYVLLWVFAGFPTKNLKEFDKHMYAVGTRKMVNSESMWTNICI